MRNRAVSDVFDFATCSGVPVVIIEAGTLNGGNAIYLASLLEFVNPQGKVVTVDIDSLAPGAVTGWAAYVAGTAWALGEAGVDVPGADLLVDSTLPRGAGLSSSASLECAAAGRCSTWAATS